MFNILANNTNNQTSYDENQTNNGNESTQDQRILVIYVNLECTLKSWWIIATDNFLVLFLDNSQFCCFDSMANTGSWRCNYLVTVKILVCEKKTMTCSVQKILRQVGYTINNFLLMSKGVLNAVFTKLVTRPPVCMSEKFLTAILWHHQKFKIH